MTRRILHVVPLLVAAGIALTIVAMRTDGRDTDGSPPPATATPVADDSGKLTAERSTQPTATATPEPTVEKRRLNPDSFQAGAAILLYRSDEGWEEDINRWYNYLAERGVNAVCLNFPIFTDGATSNQVFASERTPSDQDLRFAISQAHRMGFTVFLRPLLDVGILTQGSPYDWRGTLRPSSIPTWFNNYGDLILHYARLAEEEKVETLSVGVELVSLATSQPEEWRSLIAKVREVYAGQVTYSANWDELSRVTFWGDVDVIAIDAYFYLDVSDTPSVEEMVSAWSRETDVGAPLDIIQSAHDTWGKPVILSEFGMAAEAGAEKRAWDWGGDSPATEQDLTAQANYYRAGFIATDRPFIRGCYVWVVTPSEDPMKGDPRTDFSPWGKPAEAVISEFYRTKSP
ncbi:MAG: hypothetical protein MUP14_02070 [Dehalococcoidia bacterium]|nr:hypothetical protein [Dehalococcoidia bacterium]